MAAQSNNVNQTSTKPETKGKPTLMERVTNIVQWVMHIRPVRSYQRYMAVRGNLLAGGIAYTALFAIAGAMTIALTAFSYIVGNNAELKERLFQAINDFLPGILKIEGAEGGILDPESLIVDDPINIATIVSMLVLLWSAIALLTNLRMSILSVFGIARLPRNFALAKLLDLAGFFVIGIGAVATVVVTTAATVFSAQIFEWIGLPDSIGGIFVQIASLLLALVVDTAVFAFLYRFMAGVRPAKRDLLLGSVLAGAASSIVRILGTSAVGAVPPGFAVFAALITILLWINLLARVTLLGAALIANPPAPGQPSEAQLEHAKETPNYVTVSFPDTLEWNHDPVTGIIAPEAGEHKDDEPAPPFTGVKEMLLRKKVEKVGEKVDDAERKLVEAKRQYNEAAWEAYYKSSVPTTSDKLAKEDPKKLGDKAAKEYRKQVMNDRANERTRRRLAKKEEEKAKRKAAKKSTKSKLKGSDFVEHTDDVKVGD